MKVSEAAGDAAQCGCCLPEFFAETSAQVRMGSSATEETFRMSQDETKLELIIMKRIAYT